MDADKRQKELIHTANNDWTSNSAPTSYITSLPARHKERLLSSLDSASMRGTTPERAEFEVLSGDGEEDHPSIMDEDEWTDRNFGNSLIEDGGQEDNNTSEDSVSDLDSSDDEDDSDEENVLRDEAGNPLSAKEARQLQRAWLKRYRRGEDRSEYDNVPGSQRYVYI